jgi:chorismate mutase|tara:strand:- start:146 stop:427 length:282 start_codon:yes stop_codon:yes gene_type:complete
MKNINIQKIRKKLDKIDIRLLGIIKERSALVDKVVKLKKTKNEIIDKKRIKFILKRIKKNSIKAKIDPMITVSIWKEMIKAFIKYEYKNFKKK